MTARASGPLPGGPARPGTGPLRPAAGGMHRQRGSALAGHQYPEPRARGLAGTGLVADDIYLLGHDDRSGRPLLQPRALGIGLAGALLADLILAGLIGLRPDNAVVITRETPRDVVARHRLLRQVAAEPWPQPARSWLRFLAPTAARDVALRLEAAGYLERARGRVRWRQGQWVPVNPDWAFAPMLLVRSALDPTRPLTARAAALAGLAVRLRAGIPAGEVPDPGRSQHPGRRRPARPRPAGADRPDPGRGGQRRAVAPHLKHPHHLLNQRSGSLIMSTQAVRAPASAMSRALARDRLGMPAVLAFILAGVAPLTVAAGVIPSAYATTGLTGIPAAFLAVAVILALFATGYMAMARRITNAGAFYAFIARGLGRIPGTAAALVALAAYSLLQVALYGAFGPAAASQAAASLGVHAPWWAWALAAWAVITVLGLLRVDITGKVLGVLTAAEIVVIIAEAISGLASPAGGHLSFATLSPSALTSAGLGTAGVLAVVAVLGFTGFEQAPVLAEEARQPRRTIPVTTYLALGVIGIVYAGSAWAMAARAGQQHVVAAAAAQGPGLLFGLGGGPLPQAAQWLFLTSLFAAMLAFHNCVWRYAFALGREGVLPAVLEPHGRQQRPGDGVACSERDRAGRDRRFRAGRRPAHAGPVLRPRHDRRVRAPAAVRADLRSRSSGSSPATPGGKPGRRRGAA